MAATLCFIIPCKTGILILSAVTLIIVIVHAWVFSAFWEAIKLDTNAGAAKCAMIMLILQCIARVLYAGSALFGALRENSQAVMAAFGFTVLGLICNFVDMMNAAVNSDSLDLTAVTMMSMCFWLYTNLKIWEFHQDGGK